MSSTVAKPQAPETSAALMTAEEFFRLYENRRAELVKGIVKELPMPGAKHGKVCMTIGYSLSDHVRKHDLGHVMGYDTFMKTRTNPDAVRGMDVCYCSYERLPKGEVPDGMLPVSPELVVEVRSPSDTWTDMFAKVVEYLAAGVGVVIVLDPKTTSASVYRAEELQQIFHNGDELTLPELPGFAVAVGRLFE